MRLGLGECLVVAAAVFAGPCQGLDDDGGGGLSTRAGNESNVFSGALSGFPSCSVRGPPPSVASVVWGSPC